MMPAPAPVEGVLREQSMVVVDHDRRSGRGAEQPDTASSAIEAPNMGMARRKPANLLFKLEHLHSRAASSTLAPHEIESRSQHPAAIVAAVPGESLNATIERGVAHDASA